MENRLGPSADNQGVAIHYRVGSKRPPLVIVSRNAPRISTSAAIYCSDLICQDQIAVVADQGLVAYLSSRSQHGGCITRFRSPHHSLAHSPQNAGVVHGGVPGTPLISLSVDRHGSRSL
jgi:hypothetical protein